MAKEYLNLNVTFANLSQDGSILGLTTYADTQFEFIQTGCSRILPLKRNQIVLDSSFIQPGNVRRMCGRRRFTLAHECAHQILFQLEKDESKPTHRRAYAERRVHTPRSLKTHEDWNEWQANALGAAILIEETLKRHEAILDKMANDRGYCIAKTYYEVVSGESIAARPEIQKMLEEVSAGLYAGVLVVDVERLARGNGADQAYISQVFQFSGPKIITPTKVYDPSNEFDEEYFEFGLFMSRREYKTINRRLIRRRDSSASEGKYLGSIALMDTIKANQEKSRFFSTLANTFFFHRKSVPDAPTRFPRSVRYPPQASSMVSARMP
ncbi:MAG: recombinase family protein [Clostridiales bacterium]|nr:recombinase family protein [Clostridiales bacterium]